MYAKTAITSSSNVPDIDDVHANASLANEDPFKFSHGLTGVDQPSNYHAVHLLVAIASIPVLLALAHRILLDIQHRSRFVTAHTSSRRQSHVNYKLRACWASIKRSFLLASFRTRWHEYEVLAASTRSNCKPLTQPQFSVITIYIMSNIAYCTIKPSGPASQQLAELRGRCGTLATFNLILTILFALRNNPLIRIIHVSYDTFNLFHRWAARLVVFETIAHVGAFAVNAYNVAYDGYSGWDSISWILQHSLSYQAGLIAFISFSMLTIHSIRTLRHAFYDTFLTLHRLGVLIAISGLYFHLAKHALPQLSWVYVIIALLVVELSLRMCRILYYNWSRRHCVWTHVTLEALPEEATRVTIQLPRSWNATPGSHVHLYLPQIALWSSHPFSIAWSQSQPTGYTSLDREKGLVRIENPDDETEGTALSCIIRARSGMTRALFECASSDSTLPLWGAIEGPYGGFHSLDSYDTAVLFAAGVGITHQLLFVRQLLAGHASDTAVTHNILLVWCIRDIEAWHWIEPWLEELAEMEHFHEVVRVRLYISRASTITTNVPPYMSVRQARCDPQEVLDEHLLTQDGAMAITVCGPASFNTSVRRAVRRSLSIRDMDFFEESFSY